MARITAKSWINSLKIQTFDIILRSYLGSTAVFYNLLICAGNIQKTKIMASGPITSWQTDAGNNGNSERLF